jgi:hypothetical protein
MSEAPPSGQLPKQGRPARPLPQFSFEDPPPGPPQWPWELWKFVDERVPTMLAKGDGLLLCHMLAEGSMRALRDAALLGDKNAAAFLHTLTTWACADLANVVESSPTLLADVAPLTNEWPMLVGPGKFQRRIVDERLKSLGVGTKTPLQVARPKKQPEYLKKQPYKDLSKLLGFVAFCRTRQIEVGPFADADRLPEWVKEAAILPSLTHDSASVWFNVLWAVLCSVTDEKPENRKELWELGQNREFWAEEYRNHSDPPADTRGACIRDGIRTAMRRAFLKMVPKTDSK